MGRRGRRLGLLAATIGALSAMHLPAAAQGEFRVCADPNNLPFSDSKGTGFENKLAELVARDLGEQVTYTWWAQRRGFVRNTLKARKCDVIMGVPARLDMVTTTRPYYRSMYVFLSRADRKFDIRSMTDPQLRKLAIGVHLIGDDGSNTPPAQALGEEGIIGNVRGYMIYGVYRNADPPARLTQAVESGEVDIAAVWGPLAGYAAKRSPVPLRIVPIEGTARFAPLVFAFDIAMGVRKGDNALKARLDQTILRKHAEIEALLRSYGVPLAPIAARTADTHTAK
jgi:quinoprotein dehydrogenase-associated probable ABC transporter substrate-binding protein